MSFARPYGTVVIGNFSLAPGTLTGTILPAPPVGQRYYIYDMVMTTNDTTPQLITIADTAAAPVLIAKAYAVSSSATAVTSDIGAPCTPGKSLTVTAGAVTAAKTVEVRVTALLSAT